MTITMEIPPEWLTEAGLQNFKPVRSSIRCAAPHGLLALAEIEPFVRLVPIDANGFRRSKMMPVLEIIRDDRPSKEPIQVIRQVGQCAWQVFAASHYGIARFEISAPSALPPANRFRLIFQLLAWRWQLVGLRLPENIQNLLADELIKAVRERR
jgi:hypothetical protein